MLVLLMSAEPVALPVMVTVNMVVGSKELAKRDVLVTRFSAAEDVATFVCGSARFSGSQSGPHRPCFPGGDKYAACPRQFPEGHACLFCAFRCEEPLYGGCDRARRQTPTCAERCRSHARRGLRHAARSDRSTGCARQRIRREGSSSAGSDSRPRVQHADFDRVGDAFRSVATRCRAADRCTSGPGCLGQDAGRRRSRDSA